MNVFLLMHTKEDILKNVSTFHRIFYMDIKGAHKLFGYPYSSKYLNFCLTEERN